MTNAVEHAYPSERTGPVALTASCAGEMLEVVVCDQGVWHDPPPTRAVGGGACS